MHTANFNKVGGSVMIAVPPALLDLLHIGAGAKVGLAVDNGRLVVDPQARPRYTLNNLLAQCDGAAELTEDDRTWLDDTPVSDELIWWNLEISTSCRWTRHRTARNKVSGSREVEKRCLSPSLEHAFRYALFQGEPGTL